MNIKRQNIRGFSIIEVVLVLAIAGLIFLMVFIALPALQSGQRDTARKNDVGSVGSAVNTYVSSNKGQYPPNNATLQQYATNVSTNTVPSQITIIARPASNKVTPVDGDVTVVKAAKCSTTTTSPGTADLSAGTQRQYVVITRLEAGGGSAFCQEF